MKINYPIVYLLILQRRFGSILSLTLLFCILCFWLFDIAFSFEVIKLQMHGSKKFIEAVDGRILVKFHKNVTRDKKELIHKKIGSKVISEIPIIDWEVVQLPEGMSIPDVIKSYKKLSEIADAVPDTIYKLSTVVPNDPLAHSQYALGSVNAYSGWEFETGLSNPVTIAVIDTGIDFSHPEFSSKIDYKKGFDCSSGDPYDDNVGDVYGHGTSVAGIACANTNNNEGIAGISWNARIMSLRVFGDESGNLKCLYEGEPTTADDVLAKALVYASSVSYNTGKRIVINLSLGKPPDFINNSNTYGCPEVLVDAVNVALSSNVVIVAASGNNTSDVDCPARIPGVIAVGAIDSKNNLADFSNYGPQLTVVAPGKSVVSAKMGGGYDFSLSGTSFSSPHVAGLSALLLSKLPTATTTQIINILQNTSDDMGEYGKDEYFGFGRINVFKALRYVSKGSLSDFKGEKKPVAFPNPFKVSRDRYVSFAFPQSISGTGLEIKIFTSEGELVRTINTLTWDGKNEAGMFVSSGIYVFMVKSDRGHLTGKFVLIR